MQDVAIDVEEGQDAPPPPPPPVVEHAERHDAPLINLDSPPRIPDGSVRLRMNVTPPARGCQSPNRSRIPRSSPGRIPPAPPVQLFANRPGPSNAGGAVRPSRIPTPEPSRNQAVRPPIPTPRRSSRAALTDASKKISGLVKDRRV